MPVWVESTSVCSAISPTAVPPTQVFSISKNDPSQPINYLLGGHHSFHSHWEKLQPLEKELGYGWDLKKKKESECILQQILLVRFKNLAKCLGWDAKAFFQVFLSHHKKIFVCFMSVHLYNYS